MTSEQNDARRRMFRRTALKRTVLGSTALALGCSAVATPAAAETTVSGGGDALQNAIDAATAGETIIVTDSATYDPIVIDVGVTVDTEANPTILGGGGTGAAVSIDADGVRFSGFSVTNPDGLLGVKVEHGVDDVSIANNIVEDIGPTGRLGVTGIIVGQGDHDEIEIANNTIRNLDQETTSESGFPTLNGILFDSADSNRGTLSNSMVANNVIQELESDIAPLGIVVQHKTDSVGISNNEIRELVASHETDSDPSDDGDFGFTFAQGINIDTPSTVDTMVTGNVIEDITSEEAILPEAVKIDGDGGGVKFRRNDFLVAVGLNNRNGTAGGRDPSNDPVVDARNNYWGSRQGPEEAPYNQAGDDDDRAEVIGNVVYEPYQRNPKG